MQRKLSEIAEIPKILSSTLTTVSQTFDKLANSVPPPTITPNHSRQHSQNGNDYCPYFYGNEQKRKLSYDEDVYDYELSDETEGGGEEGGERGEDEMSVEEVEEFDAKEAYQQLKRYAARQRRSKEETPESDYASESNYQENQHDNKNQNDMTSDNDVDDNDDDDEVKDYDENDDDYYCNDNTTTKTIIKDEDDDDNEKSCDLYEEFNMSVLKIPSDHANSESDTEEFEEGVDDNNDDDADEDFLTTTFTWNLSNKPKLQINPKKTKDDDNNDSNLNQRDNNDKDSDKLNVSQQISFIQTKDMLNQECQTKAVTPDKEQKVCKNNLNFY